MNNIVHDLLHEFVTSCTNLWPAAQYSGLLQPLARYSNHLHDIVIKMVLPVLLNFIDTFTFVVLFSLVPTCRVVPSFARLSRVSPAHHSQATPIHHTFVQAAQSCQKP